MSKKKINIEQIKKEQIFQVPDRYFEQLSSNIESRIALEAETEDSSAFSTDALKAKDSFRVPANYFEALQSKIEAKTTGLESNEALELNPALFSKTLPFQVPETYFKELPLAVMEKVEVKKSAWTLNLDWLIQKKWALVPVMMMVIIASYFFFTEQNETVGTDELIAQISTDDLIAYLEASEMTTEDILDNINIDEFSGELDVENESLLDEIELDGEMLDELLDEFNFI